MGVTDNRRNIYFSQNSLGQNGDTSSEEDWQIIDGNVSDESPPPTPAPVIPPAPPSALTSNKKKLPVAGHKLLLKKGRRSMHRYKEERNLLQSLGEDANADDAQEGWDIGYQDSKSHFTSLLCSSNENLLDIFVNDCEKVDIMVRAATQEQRKRRRVRKESVDDNLFDYSSEDEVDDPEESFLSISQNLRQAIKKHLPLGMLEGLESQIRDFFIIDPDSVYIASDLSSYERLLVHAASSYNHLLSRSVDENGKRMLIVENRNKHKTFKPVDPSLSMYLKIRSRIDLN